MSILSITSIIRQVQDVKYVGNLISLKKKLKVTYLKLTLMKFNALKKLIFLFSFGSAIQCFFVSLSPQKNREKEK